MPFNLSEHFNSDDTCDCPIHGECWGCHKPCNDHDIIVFDWWCSECLNKHFDEDGLK